MLEQVSSGAISVDAAVERVRHMPFEDIGFAKLDHHRALRCGMAEVILGKGKTPEQVAAIASRLVARNPNVLATRCDRAIADAVIEQLPDAEYFPLSGRAARVARPHHPGQGQDQRGVRRDE